MRKALLIAALSAFAFASISDATAEGAKVYYKQGTVIEDPDAGFKLKLNFQLQPLYRFQDYENSELFGLEDTQDVRMRRARLVASGSVLDKQVSFKLQTDFVGTKDDSGARSPDLRDAWIQWNADDAAKLRLGQFKVPYSQQELISSTKLQFVERSIATEEFAVDRQGGIMMSGEMDGLGYQVAATNGESDNEGRNRLGQDVLVLGSGQVYYADNFDREQEGDYENTEGLGWTIGGAAAYGSGDTEGTSFDVTRLNGDIGVRSAGLSLQAEILWRSVDFDSLDEKVEDSGYYAQVGYFFVPEEWEIAYRFATINFDSDYDGTDIFEHTVNVGYYIMGHDLKVLTGVTIEDYDYPEENDEYDSTDVRFDLMVAGYF